MIHGESMRLAESIWKSLLEPKMGPQSHNMKMPWPTFRTLLCVHFLLPVIKFFFLTIQDKT